MNTPRPTLVLLLLVCLSASAKADSPSIERLDPRFDALVGVEAEIEFLGEGYFWSEGPVWVREGGFLLFSDVPANTVYRYRAGEGVTEYLKPSGYTGQLRQGGMTGPGGGVDESGSNGLALDAQGRLLLCQHGDRVVARLNAPLTDERPSADFTVLAAHWGGKQFSSPNDLAVHSTGAIYFTDPPYGLEKGGDAATRQIDFNGVYRVAPDGQVTLATRSMTKPNGVVLSPDESTLYVTQSDPQAPLIQAFPVREDGSLGKSRVFYDASERMRSGMQGNPDGMAVDMHGNLFATGPGGVLVLSPEGELLGVISTGDLIANCVFGDDDGRTLYLTTNHRLARVRVKTQGLGF